MKHKSTKPVAKRGRSKTETSGKQPAARATSKSPAPRAASKSPAARSASGASARRTSTRSGQTSGAKPGTERARDEQRTSGGPRYGGGPWTVAEQRGGRRFGHARNDDADPSELAPGATDQDEDDRPTTSDDELAAAEASGEIESGGQRRGMRRGDEPRGVKTRSR